MNLQKAISTPKAIALVLLSAIVLVGGALGYKLLNPPQIEEPEIFIEPRESAVKEPTGGETDGEDLANLDTSGWQTYRNEEWGFEIEYLSDWEYEVSQDEISLGVGFMDPEQENMIGLAVIPKESMKDDFGEFSTVREAMNNWLEEIGEDKDEPGFPNIEIILINGQETLRAIYPPDPVDGSLEAVAFLLRGNNMFWLNQSWANSLNVYNQMLSTFKFID